MNFIQKDFDKWNNRKKRIHTRAERILFHERKIWWCALGANIGYEQDGKNHDFERPIIIARQLSPDTCAILPLTTKKRLEKFQAVINHGNIKNYALLDQIRVIDARRLLRKIGLASEKEFSYAMQKLKQIL